jgi:hypothetical protein
MTRARRAPLRLALRARLRDAHREPPNYPRHMDQGRITIDWTRQTDGSFDWHIKLDGSTLTDAEIEAILTEIAQRT